MSDFAKFHIGQLVEHELFGYRGVIFNIDSEFSLTDEWYETMAKSRPRKDKPWYHVLVHDVVYTTYVSQQNLNVSTVREQINHPELGNYFTHFIDGQYQPRRKPS